MQIAPGVAASRVQIVSGWGGQPHANSTKVAANRVQTPPGLAASCRLIRIPTGSYLYYLWLNFNEKYENTNYSTVNACG
jgi:hypothetical protein